MAKKRRIYSEENINENKTNIEGAKTTAVAEKSNWQEQMTAEEIESLKNYKPLQISFKMHILIFAVLFALFSLLFFGYIKTVHFYADKYIAEGEMFVKIADILNKEDTGALVIYQTSESYQLLNELQSSLAKDLGAMFDMIKAKHIPDTLTTNIKSTKMLLPKAYKAIEDRINIHYKNTDLSFLLNKYKNTTLELEKKIDALLAFNQEIVKRNEFDKTHNKFQKILIETKDLYFELENLTLRLRGLWNRAAAFDAALELFQKAINVDNRSIKAYYKLGKIYELMNEPELAGERFVMVIKLEPESALAKEVFEKFKQAVEKNKDNLQDRYNLAMAYKHLKMKEKAREEFKFIVDKDKELKTMLGFMADKRIKELDANTPEVLYDPRI